MKKTIFMDKYPIYSLKLEKNEISQNSMLEVVEYFEEKIKKHPIAKHISSFDQYAHTKSLNGEIMEGLLGAKNVIFCFGSAIPNTKILAARPRSIGICEFENHYVIEFIEAPKEEMHNVMETWAKGLVR